MSSGFFRVTDPRQAELLTAPDSKRYFAPFLAQGRTVTEAAQIVGCALNTMLYRVKGMLGAGLIEVVERRPRAGRTVKVYRSVHDAYFVPFAATPYATLEERVAVQGQPLFARLTAGYAAVLREHEHAGNTLRIGEDGAVWTSDHPPTTTHDGHSVVFNDMTVRLEPDRAQTVATELMQTFTQALRTQQAGAPRQSSQYLVMVALIPLR